MGERREKGLRDRLVIIHFVKQKEERKKQNKIEINTDSCYIQSRKQKWKKARGGNGGRERKTDTKLATYMYLAERQKKDKIENNSDFCYMRCRKQNEENGKGNGGI